MLITFSVDEPLEKVLRLVEKVYGVSVEVADGPPDPTDDVTLTPDMTGARPKHDRT